MLAVISPAKNLDFETEAPIEHFTDYRLADQAQSLIERLRELSVADVKKMMKLSDKLAELNVARYQQWQPVMTAANSKPAMFAFNGDVYTGLSANTLTGPQIGMAQNRLRILSGLYGLLRPLDRIQPYRLEMGTRLQIESANSLYEFWGDTITGLLEADCQENQVDVLINLASQEYFKAVNPEKLSVPVITPVFKDEKNGEFKIISFFAKKARGMMVRYMLEQELETVHDLQAFDYGGYQFSAAESDDCSWVFKRS
ncbi:MAG: peroxide stress protein YaaA [Reinekea sp.]